MIISISGNQYDLTYFFLGIFGITLLLLYIVFASNAIQNENKVVSRHWEYSVGIAVTFGGLVEVFFFFRLIGLHFGEAKNIIEQIAVIGKAVLLPLACIAPFLFIVTLGAYSRLNWSSKLMNWGLSQFIKPNEKR